MLKIIYQPLPLTPYPPLLPLTPTPLTSTPLTTPLTTPLSLYPPHPYPQGAMVAPSEEDSQTFTVSGSNGELYRLRATDSRERQHWVTRMRRQVELCNSKANKEVGQFMTGYT